MDKPKISFKHRDDIFSESSLNTGFPESVFLITGLMGLLFGNLFNSVINVPYLKSYGLLSVLVFLAIGAIVLYHRNSLIKDTFRMLCFCFGMGTILASLIAVLALLNDFVAGIKFTAVMLVSLLALSIPLVAQSCWTSVWDSTNMLCLGIFASALISGIACAGPLFGVACALLYSMLLYIGLITAHGIVYLCARALNIPII